MISPIKWEDNQVVMIDQRKLPWEEKWLTCRNYQDVARCIKELVIRGAPAIGVAAAMGMALGALKINTNNPDIFYERLKKISDFLASQRPTAVNLIWALKRQEKRALSLYGQPVEEVTEALITEARAMLEEDIAINRRIGANGVQLVPNKATILTHCNAGALATGGYGTALGVVRAAIEAGKKVAVLADETRPFLQGARLTAWELNKDRIPVKVITDNMAGHFLKSGLIDLVVVGADRIAANGDVANKIGTYSVAVLAKENRVPFYVAAPLSTIDRSAYSGAEIPIEERTPKEITHIRGRQITPSGVGVLHPAFDITPSKYIKAIITEAGLAQKPFRSGINRLFKKINKIF
ncbi:MAG: S-methyl-5-thioribose-1-phosphate isomerase [Deltaproteobacteria bacterium]|nr:S-methyl-5-thioribose-1-phosphate isomerase [Deltaproteobacteria bacterium]